MNEQPYSKVAPDFDEIRAGDEVVVLDGDGGIADVGVLCDVDGGQAEVRVGDLVHTVSSALIAHLDAPAAAEAYRRERLAVKKKPVGSVGASDRIRPSDWPGEEHLYR